MGHLGGRGTGHAGRGHRGISDSRSPAEKRVFDSRGPDRDAGSSEYLKVHHGDENKMSTPVTVVTPPSHWYSSLLHFLHHVGVEVSDGFIALFGKDSAHSFAIGAESLLKSKLGVLALEAVQEVENMAS